jgi:hypothetical protein
VAYVKSLSGSARAQGSATGKPAERSPKGGANGGFFDVNQVQIEKKRKRRK